MARIFRKREGMPFTFLLIFAIVVCSQIALAEQARECDAGIQSEAPIAGEVDATVHAPWWPGPARRPVVALNNTVERFDFNNTIFEVLQELGAEVINLTALNKDDQFKALERSHSYWGLHIYNLEQLQAMPKNLLVNTIWSARSLFGDKDGLTNLVKQARAQLGTDQVDFTPDAYILPDDMTAFTARVRESPGNLYMRKYLNTHSGSGVKLMTAKSLLDDFNSEVSTCQDQTRISECNPEYVVVAQRYIEDPLLVYGHKFDVRWWCLITNTEPLRAYMLSDGYAKIAISARYDVSDTENKCSHVTNNLVQKHCLNKFRHGHISPIFANFNASVRSDDFKRAIHPVDPDELYRGAQDIMRKVLRASSWRLEAQQQFHKLKTLSYQLLAIDVIYDRSSNKAHLIEINTNGYLQTGILKIANGRERLKDVFRMTGTVGFPLTSVNEALLAGASADDVRRILENKFKGGWAELPIEL